MGPNAEQPSVSGASERLYLTMNLLDEIKPTGNFRFENTIS